MTTGIGNVVLAAFVGGACALGAGAALAMPSDHRVAVAQSAGSVRPVQYRWGIGGRWGFGYRGYRGYGYRGWGYRGYGLGYHGRYWGLGLARPWYRYGYNAYAGASYASSLYGYGAGYPDPSYAYYSSPYASYGADYCPPSYGYGSHAFYGW